MYGTIVCGIRNIRIWFGPLPFEMCYLQFWGTTFMIWYIVLLLFLISLIKFMFICVWKHMRDMIDDLMVRFAVIWAIFISALVPSIGVVNRKGNASEKLCTGIFSDHAQILQKLISPKDLPQPFSPILWTFMLAILVFIIAAKIELRKISHKEPTNQKTIAIQRPKDMESMLLNSTLLVLLLINLLGFYLFWSQ